MYDTASQKDILKARWFTRSWKMQESIAPRDIIIYSKNWQKLGSKSDVDMRRSIKARTTIDKDISMHSERLLTASVARRILWASSRETTRPEDIACCLLGLFVVHMPLFYSEGTNAFIRLHEEIIKASEDESILVWAGGFPTEMAK